MRSDQARNIPLDKYLTSQGHTPIQVRQNGRELWYRSPIRDGDKTPSFKVDTSINKWYDHGAGRGGNTLDLAIEFFNGSVRDALAHLEKTNLYASMAYPTPQTSSSPTPIQMVLEERRGAIEKKKSLVLIKVIELKHPALLQYLDKRKISKTIAAKYLKQIYYKHPEKNKEYFALGFPSKNGFEARNEFFKGFVGSGKTISKFIYPGSQDIYIFEGFMDFLTFLTMNGLGHFEASAIVMNSAALKQPVIDELAAGNFSKVHLYLDNDATGKDLAEHFEDKLPDLQIHNHSNEYKKHKDLNEYFISLEL